MPRVLILAYGNPLRSDDGLAWRAAEILRARITPSEVEILSLHQLAPELAENLSRTQAVIFVDSAQPVVGETAGEIQVRELASGSGDPTHSSHSLSPQTLIALAS